VVISLRRFSSTSARLSHLSAKASRRVFLGVELAWADELGRDDIVRLLTTNLNEEKAADKKLSNVALRKGVNRKVAS